MLNTGQKIMGINIKKVMGYIIYLYKIIQKQIELSNRININDNRILI